MVALAWPRLSPRSRGGSEGRGGDTGAAGRAPVCTDRVRMPLTSPPVRVSRPVSVAQVSPSERRCPPLVQPSSGFGTPIALTEPPEGIEGGGPQVGMIRVTAFLLLKWGPFARHSAMRECPVRRRPVEKPPPSSGAGASPSQSGGRLARVGQGKVPRGPGAGPAWVRGGLRDCPTPPDPAPRPAIGARRCRRAPGTLTSPRACPGTEAQDCLPRDWDLALSSNHGKYRLCARDL